MYITHSIVCRNCLHQVNVNYIFKIDDMDLGDYKKLTDYYLMKRLITGYQNNGFKCKNCNSNNIQPMNLRVDDYFLYDYDRIGKRIKGTDEQMYVLSLSKKDNIITPKIGGRENGVSAQFLSHMIFELYKIIEQTDEASFVRHQMGNFFVCFTGYYDHDTWNVGLRLERLYYFGFSKIELLEFLEKRKKEYIQMMRDSYK